MKRWTIEETGYFARIDAMEWACFGHESPEAFIAANRPRMPLRPWASETERMLARERLRAAAEPKTVRAAKPGHAIFGNTYIPLEPFGSMSWTVPEGVHTCFVTQLGPDGAVKEFTMQDSGSGWRVK